MPSLPIGTYTVDAYFSGTIPLPSGDLNLPDDRYLPASTTGSLTVIEPMDGLTLYLSTPDAGEVDGIAYSGEDVLAYSLDSGEWSLLFDGSDVGLANQDVMAFAWLPDGSLLIATGDNFYLPELDAPAEQGGNNVGKADILRFVPESLGEATVGSWELYFDGSDVGLKSPQETIDALTVLADGRIVISTSGPFKSDGVIAKSRDLVAFTPTSLGENTAGSWELYFDGSDVGLLSASSQNLKAVHQDEADSELYIVTSSADGFVWVCTPEELGKNTDCAFTLFWDGAANGLDSAQIDAIAIR